MKTLKEWSGVIALLAIILTWIFPSPNMFGATGTRMPNGISTDTTSPVVGEVRGTTLTITGAMTAAASTLSGLLTTNAGTLHSYTNATSTATTAATLKLSDVNGYDSIVLTPNIGALTLTFFASSTASAWLPTAGDTQRTCVFNETTTNAATITFAGGTGVDIETVATTTTAGVPSGMLAIPAMGSACFVFMRQYTSTSTFDISALYTPYLNAD